MELLGPKETRLNPASGRFGSGGNRETRGVTSQFPADFWFDMTDGAGNCATARASLSLEDLENEMRRAIPRPVHHNEFFSQRWAIFAPPLFFARLPAL